MATEIKEFITKEVRTDTNQLCEVDKDGNVVAIPYKRLALPSDEGDLFGPAMTRMDRRRWEVWREIRHKERTFELKTIQMENHHNNKVLHRAKRLALRYGSKALPMSLISTEKLITPLQPLQFDGTLFVFAKRRKDLVGKLINTYTIWPESRHTEFINDEYERAKMDYIRTKEFFPKYAYLPAKDERVVAYEKARLKDGPFKGKFWKAFFRRVEHYQQGFVIPGEESGQAPQWRPLGWTKDDEHFRYFPEKGYIQVARVLNALSIQVKQEPTPLVKFYLARWNDDYKYHKDPESGKWIGTLVEKEQQ